MTRSNPGGKAAAFSLVEVTVAIGIVAFALVAILGLVSLSEQASKNATDETNLALMTQTVITLLRTSGISGSQSAYVSGTATLPAGSANYLTYYFDASGAPVHDSSGSGNLISGTNGVSNVANAATNPIYVCTVMNKTPVIITSGTTPTTNFVDIPQAPANFAYAYFRLDFAWPYIAPAANQQHKYAYTSLAQYY